MHLTRDGPKPKCFFTQANLPTFVDHDHPPIKKQPLATVVKQNFTHTLDLIVPDTHLDKLNAALTKGPGDLHYARVYMKLSEILDGDFFNTYIKSDDILMLSEGRPGIDHMYSLCEGVLRLEVDRPAFERTGLPGTAIPSQGRKHVKSRYAIEVNLRLPSMVSGKPGFDRLVWACRNVLNRSVAWLIYNSKSPGDFSGPISSHQPSIRAIEAEISHTKARTMPARPGVVDEHDFDEATALLEWMTLVASGSVRALPLASEHEMSGVESSGVSALRWHGFIPSSFVIGILLPALKVCSNDWFAMIATSFDGSAYATMKSEDHIMVWEFTD
ncbi:hypothetical protein LTR78_007531 [Recurvomyces mirabilis]|uniref:Uncharacterized protein n=1 Tax=Recurvomyces mirabilis TaxID=574656 RepID=A0AAE0WG19_9PEZI|nr:hypothetical protein LTR78_007531 [Recurvomyces mirabilis]KAK5159958.1 hypothetical protein LTS14_002064 [Recurvomyces mirabilis]